MKVLVVGETCLDIFKYCCCNRLAPEAPVPVLVESWQTTNPGMAANTHENLLTLRPYWNFTFISHKTPILKTRLVDAVSNHYFLRMDKDDEVQEGERLSTSGFVHKYGSDFLEQFDGVVISDYDKKFLTTDFIQWILVSCHENGVPTFLDTKKILGGWSEKAFAVKINEKEYSAHPFPPEKYCRNLVVTRGDKGADLFFQDGQKERIAGFEVRVSFLAGAGDTFLSALVVNYLETRNLREAVRYANAAASVAVSHRGVHAVTREEVEKVFDLATVASQSF